VRSTAPQLSKLDTIKENDMTHTKGPWLAVQARHGDDSTWRVVILKKNRVQVLTRVQTLKPSDAHLIAAAPDMLEALEVIVKDWEGEPEDMFWATAAIAKAKGETQ
jgi:hypothetical protein